MRAGLLAALLIGGLSVPSLAASGFPSDVLPDPLGVTIHFIDSQGHESDIARLAELGVRWVHIDLAWPWVEFGQRGLYRNLDGYVRLTDALAAKGIRCLDILGYPTRLYENGLPPKTAEGIAAFARFAGIAADRLKGRGVMYELWNEPNLAQYWTTTPDPSAYVALMRPAVAAVRAADPQATIEGPALAGIDLPFLEATLKQGLLEFVDGVAVHTFRPVPPETVIEDYQRLRTLIARYAPPGRRVPILAGDGGYANCPEPNSYGPAWSEEDQARFVARMWLLNALCGTRMSMWYDWKNDGPNPADPDQRFGLVTEDLTPKPSFLRAQALIQALSGYRCVKRLPVGDPKLDYALLFTTPDLKQQKIAAWTTDSKSRSLDLTPWGGSQTQLSGSPAYLPASGIAAQLEAAWSLSVPDGVEAGPLPQAHLVPATTVTVSNPTADTLAYALSSGNWDGPAQFTLTPGQTVVRGRMEALPLRSGTTSVPVTVSLSVPSLGWHSSQTTQMGITNPLSLTLVPGGGGLSLSAAGSGLDGLTAQLTGAFAGVAEQPLTSGQTFWPLAVPRDYRVGAVVRQGGTAVAVLPDARNLLVEDFSSNVNHYALPFYGDAKVLGTGSVTYEAAGPDTQFPRAAVMRYQFGQGWRNFLLSPTGRMPIDGQARAVGFWLWASEAAKGDRIWVQFVDTTNQVFQPLLTDPILWSGWRWVTLRMDGQNTLFWGGANDGIVHYPIRWGALVTVDSNQQAHSAEVRITGVTLRY